MGQTRLSTTATSLSCDCCAMDALMTSSVTLLLRGVLPLLIGCKKTNTIGDYPPSATRALAG